MNFTSVSPGGVLAEFDRAEDLQAVASSILVPLRVAAPAHADFHAEVHSARVGPVVVARIRGAPHVVHREARHITSTDGELLKLVLHQGGPATAAQHDRAYRARPGDLTAFDTTRPYRLAVADSCDVVVVGLPRTLLGANADLIARRAGVPVTCDTGARRVIAAFLSGLAGQVDDLPGRSGNRLADALASLVIALFTEVGPERAETETGPADRIRAYALANLGDPALSVESVARRHGISARYLHRLFQRDGVTFAAWVRYERLIRIRRDLLDPALSGRTAAAIAAHWGVRDPRHLSRALKKEFGLTAAELRRMARPR